MVLTLLFINKIFLSLIIMLGGGLGFWVYFFDPKRASNKMFSLVSFLSVLWGVLCFLANTAPNISVGLFWTRLAEVVVMLALLSLYFFSIYFPQKSKGKKLTNIILVCLALVIIVLVIFTDLITLRMLQTEQWGLSPVPGRLWLFFNFVSSLILVLTLYKLASKYPKLSKREKLKSQYSILGLFLFVIFNVVFNIILPLYNKDYRFVFDI